MKPFKELLINLGASDIQADTLINHWKQHAVDKDLAEATIMIAMIYNAKHYTIEGLLDNRYIPRSKEG